MTQSYPAYRDSGEEWLREVPVGWGILSPRRIFSQVRDPASDKDEQLSATQKSGVIPQRLYMEQEDQKVVLALTGLGNFKQVKQGDFVISLRSFQGGIEYSAYDGCVSPAYTVLRPTALIIAAYFRYLLKSDEFILKLQSVTTGIRAGRNVSFEQFAMVPLCVPPLPEQTAIAAFLDVETAKIDGLVAEQRRLIDLLREKRQAVISHTVTRGLNPHAKLKPSGIDWLGDVPEGWEVGPLKRFWSVTDCKHLTADFVDEGFPLGSGLVPVS
jgi:type I restriction enzyme S subunit